MSKHIISILKKKLDELSGIEEIDAETFRNGLKETLQLYVLNFVYHHPEYRKWIMYGGSSLRIIHGLDRMSVDLDFEINHKVTNNFLGKLKSEIENHFINEYAAEPGFLTIKTTKSRGLLLKFKIGGELELEHPSEQVHIKIDLNHFVAPKPVTEHRPINQDQLSFVITTYNMASLMASKIAAIFLRGTRGVGKAIYKEKGRDIYDLLWYMNKKTVPNLDYLTAKNIVVNDLRALFDKLTIKMNTVNDENLKQDLLPLFTNKTYIKNWLKNWRESYLQLVNEYKFHVITSLKLPINVYIDYPTDTLCFTYTYETEEQKDVTIRYFTTDYWIEDVDLQVNITKKLEDNINITSNGSSTHPPSTDRIKQYAMLFYKKSEQYLIKSNRTIFGNRIVTKLIRTTADNFNPEKQIILNKSALLSCELEDLLK